MKKSTEIYLLSISFSSIVVTMLICIKFCLDVKDIFTFIGGVLAVNFFLYKVFTGWLFINLNVNAHPLREKANKGFDHLTIKIVLSKGTTDSVWLHDIEVRIRTIVQLNSRTIYKNEYWLKPTNFQKLQIKGSNYWYKFGSKHYVISSGEEATFTVYTKVKSGDVISAEIVVLGTRPFYGTFQETKVSQWRSSLIILPK